MGFIKEYREVNRLLQQKHPVVFYAESRHYQTYFEHLLNGLLSSGTMPVCYITSDKQDPLLLKAPHGLQVIYCKWMLGHLFRHLQADVMVMTLTDLGHFFLKRSARVGRYVYVFHAAVSTHLQYRKQAFDHYDTIFCTGPYQVKELRKAETVYGLPARELLPYGYPLLNRLSGQPETGPKEKELVLVAPSWFAGCIFETCLEPLIRELSLLPVEVRIRSHPEYEKRYPGRFRRIRKLIGSYPGMKIDTEPDVMKSLAGADILVTDRSGIAFESAFGSGKPVLFVDTELKQTNPDWQELELEPVEIRYRSMMGVSVSPLHLDELPGKIRELREMRNGFAERMKSISAELFFTGEENLQNGVGYIQGLTGSV